MADPKNDVVALLRGYAKKFASTPDRMTTADGQGGITTSQQQPKADPGEGDLKQDLPTDGTMRQSPATGGSPDRMTTADGQGGITASSQQPKKDVGEGELKQDLPTDGTVRKSARVDAIRAALFKSNPSLGKAATAPQGAAPAATGASGNINLSQDVLAKIASDILSTEEGINYVYNNLEKQAGAQAAREEIANALRAAEAFDEVEQIKSAAINDVFTKAAAIHADLSAIINEAEADEILKTAAVHQAALIELDHPLLKQAYAAGMGDAATLEGGDEAAAEGGADADLPMSGDQLGEEEVLALLAEMVQNGDITEEEIMQALGEGGGAEGAAPEGAEPPVAPAV